MKVTRKNRVLFEPKKLKNILFLAFYVLSITSILWASQKPLTFTMASCNVLNHDTFVTFQRLKFYDEKLAKKRGKKFAENQANKIADARRITLDSRAQKTDRTRIFEKYLNSDLLKADILVFQEWPNPASHQYQRWTPLVLKYFKNTVTGGRKNEILIAYNNKFEAAKIPEFPQNPTTFSVYSTVNNPAGKEATAFILTPDKGKTTIGIIGCHLKGGPDTDKIAQGAKVMTFIQQHKSVKNWIVCGDFNWNRRKYFPDIAKTFALKTQFLDADPQGLAHALGAVDTFEQIDYLFYTPDFSLTNFHVVPTHAEQTVKNNQKKLISHHQDTKQNPKDWFFSDHPILMGTFTLKLTPEQKIITNKSFSWQKHGQEKILQLRQIQKIQEKRQHDQLLYQRHIYRQLFPELYQQIFPPKQKFKK